ncbi:MerR family transcriptional regulator [Paenibacillus pedocola]|uniref:MerR family transcriptional regulator n=1 Tax=Paenibacillus pedocola TaxID=3242193 RepID=UPI002877E041|nr:MerR family transcriptional regulator [Paenibacillus typhae]
MAEQWGHFEMILESAMSRRGIGSGRLAQLAQVQRSQLQLYITNEIKRPDLGVLARICTALGCEIGEVMKYIPPEAPAKPKPLLKQGADLLYTTGQIAQELGVHPNTIRFYEQIGLLSPVERSNNHYRQFTHRHLAQLRICRLIFGTPFTNRTLRNTAFSVLTALKPWDVQLALTHATAYQHLLENEYASALETASLLKNWTEKRQLPSTGNVYTHKEAASLLGVTPEVLRNWERNGLIDIPRERNQARVYGDSELARLRIIYMLRQNHYSIAAIQRSLLFFDSGNSAGAILALNQPTADSEIEFISAGDHWLETLGHLSISANKIKQIVMELQ